MSQFVGVDPGLGGGIAVIGETGHVISTHTMPETERDVYELFRSISHCDQMYRPETKAVIERVRSSPQMGVTSAFTFGRGFGGLLMALVACRISFDEVTPQRWQKILGCLTHGDKNVSKARAQQMFPDVKCNHYISDALLLAKYCRRLHVGCSVGRQDSE